MACYHPLEAFQTSSGAVVFSERARHDVVRSLFLSCGQCIGCRRERSRQWAVRCMHEASLYDRNCFITLTYDNLHLRSMSLEYRDFQLFMKRLRRRFFSSAVRFYMCGEYGETFERPHFHACLFDFDFEDKLLFKDSGDFKLYTSRVLSELWPFGFSTIGDVSFESAAYCARYCIKKITGDAAEQRYRMVDEETGEVSYRVPEFNHMSLKPGIGANWLRLYWQDVYPSGKVIVRGREALPPKYYDRMAKKLGAFEDVLYSRELLAQRQAKDRTPERLAVREQVEVARLASLSRLLP